MRRIDPALENKIIELYLNKNTLSTDISIDSNINKTGSIYRLSIYKKLDVIRFLDWMYSDSDLYLIRKYDIYLQMKNKINNG